MESRLDRLFILLDTGSTPVIRKSAAEQLGEIQRLHPQKLKYLLDKILGLMRSKTWETRVAAGQAVEAITKKVEIKADYCVRQNPHIEEKVVGPLCKFDLLNILKDGASLFSDDATTYEFTMTPGLNDTEMIQKQKQVLNRKLGLDGPVSTDLQLFDESDLIVHNTQSATGVSGTSAIKMAQEVLESQILSADMSVREVSAAKRRAKLMHKRRASSGAGPSPPVDKKMRTTSVAVEQPGQPDKVLVDTVNDGMEELDEEGWPFTDFCEILCTELFSVSWETRHGSATLLREIIKHSGSSAGVVSSDNAREENRCWLESCAVRLICMLALDRFADYISDEVVAPVRETCAQTLGTVCQYLPTESIQEVLSKLEQLLVHAAWEVRFGALLGLKYIVAVRQDLVGEMSRLWPLLLAAIQDEVDDVRAVAASCLLPITGKLPDVMPDKMDQLVRDLWAALLDLDDLTSSTTSMMSLLSALLTANRLHSISSETMVTLLPRIWPFLSHNIGNVRKAALVTLTTIFTESQQLDWMDPVLSDCLRLLYQRCLLEYDVEISHLAEQAWNSLVLHASPALLVKSGVPWFNMWICLLMQPVFAPIDPNFLIKPLHHKSSAHEQADLVQEYISGPVRDKPDIRAEKVMYTRILCARCLGRLAAQVPMNDPANGKTLQELCSLIEFHLQAKSGTQRLGAAFVLSHWAHYAKINSAMPDLPAMNHLVLRCAEESLYYDEVASLFTRLQTECRNFLACLKQRKASLEHIYPSGCIFTIEIARRLATDDFESVRTQLKKQHEVKFKEHAASLLTTVDDLQREYSMLNIRVQTSLACALISLDCLPPKLNPVIRPLMDTIKKDPYYRLQDLASTHLCRVLLRCVDRSPSPNVKVFKNLCTALCAWEKQTPCAETVSMSADDSSSVSCDQSIGIISLFTEFKVEEKKLKRGPKAKKQNSVDNSSEASTSGVQEPAEATSAEMVQYEGASSALWKISSTLNSDLVRVVPTCRDHFLLPLVNYHTDQLSIQPQALVNSLQVLMVIYGALPTSVQEEVITHISALFSCVKNDHTAVRYMSARSLASCAQHKPGQVMNYILDDVLPLLGASYDLKWRQGAIEAVYHIIDRLGVTCIPYIVLLVVPVLGRMTDQNLAIQMMASQCFALLIKLMPLEGGVENPPEMKQHLVEKKEQEREFLTQLLSGNILQNYGIPIPIKADLRKYQQDGVNWLAFLNKYKLHGILCDDMGLGKTLQSICIMAGDHYMRQNKYQETGDVESVPLPSLVVCPSTLCGHWVYEVQKFVDRDHLSALNFSALPSERLRLRSEFPNYNLIVASYEIVRNDIEFLQTVSWNYCILDEGHIIKNAKSKTTQAVKKLNCNHRLILSGTPVQNNVLELWSLFDFLMPGYLGTERQFSTKYSRPILQSRDARSSSKEQEAGALAVESLHKQVLPFMLRRLKADVLQDLPPKIIQDYFCSLSPLQDELYRQFGQSSAGHFVQQSLSSMTEDSPQKTGVNEHIFQALQYLKKVCNHPALVLQNSKHPKHERMMKDCRSQGKTITSIEYSAKLTALKQLLLDCGIGVTMASEENGVAGVVNQHRALIFCQLKMMIDIIENELLRKVLPSVTFLRLDGSTPANSRHSIVSRFNDDPSIDLLLLTTAVGGLGLNLTGADTVIFVEHDWNPMKDLQAMDRAHRIGQKKVVNVYRLITRNTLEEKIMGLQKFKLNIANTIVNQENSGLTSMATDQLLDLFSVDSKSDGQSNSQAVLNKSPSKGLKSMLQDMTELWDESEYDSEYNMNNFLASLAK